MKKWLADLHVHTLLSPCAEIEMTPHHIVMKAAETGVNMLAITDHNASANIAAAIEAGKRYGVKVLPGMEVQCKEEAHIIVLFDKLEQMECWQRIVDSGICIFNHIGRCINPRGWSRLQSRVPLGNFNLFPVRSSSGQKFPF